MQITATYLPGLFSFSDVGCWLLAVVILDKCQYFFILNIKTSRRLSHSLTHNDVGIQFQLSDEATTVPRKLESSIFAKTNK